MTAAKTVRSWYLVHKWTSLICTVFLLLLCVTGLPLIFHEEIDHWLDDGLAPAQLPADTPYASLDRLALLSQQRFPAEVVRYIGYDDEEPVVYVTMAPTADAAPEQDHWLKLDARTAQLLKQQPLPGEGLPSFTDLMFHLHVDLFAGLPGQLFLGAMGLLFVAAVISGVVIYAPFMRKLDFGAVRRERSPRLKWLDLHNLLGVVTLVWALVVGATGVFNELSTPLFGLWSMDTERTLLAPYRDKPAPQQLSSVQAAVDTVRAALPHKNVTGVNYPQKQYGSPHHYLVWTNGNTPLTSQLYTPVLVDAQTGQLTAVPELPWYLWVLNMSRPLHFGDYAGMPLKILWAVLDLITLIVLGSGLYLWLKRRKATEARIAKLLGAETTPPLVAAEVSR
jgi:uncharacterized iron-regulated membrane protein